MPETSQKKRNPRRGIYLLPNLLTTGALFAGFYSIVAAIDGNFLAAAWAIYVAMFLDGTLVVQCLAPDPRDQGLFRVDTVHGTRRKLRTTGFQETDILGSAGLLPGEKRILARLRGDNRLVSLRSDSECPTT